MNTYFVYILKSQKDSTRYYIGLTNNLDKRLKEHNSKDSYYSRRFAPWSLEIYIAFKSQCLAVSFEKYLKAGSGQAFLKKHFLAPLDSGSLESSLN